MWSRKMSKRQGQEEDDVVPPSPVTLGVGRGCSRDNDAPAFVDAPQINVAGLWKYARVAWIAAAHGAGPGHSQR